MATSLIRFAPPGVPLIPAVVCALLAAVLSAATQVAGAPMATGRDPECTVGGSAADASDVERAQRACESARIRFAELFGAAPAVHIVLHDDAGYEVASAGTTGIVFWPNSRALGGAEAGSRQDAQWREVLPHEVMHALTMARFYSEGGAGGHGGYGTPLPDWFEEGIAIFGEPEASRSGRLRQARDLPPHRRELKAILRGAHPVAGNTALMAPVPGAPVPQDEALRAFYPQAIAVLSFVLDAGGPAAVGELARRLVAQPTNGAALHGLPGLPADDTGLMQAWDRWLAERP